MLWSRPIHERIPSGQPSREQVQAICQHCETKTPGYARPKSTCSRRTRKLLERHQGTGETEIRVRLRMSPVRLAKRTINRIPGEAMASGIVLPH
ncbi:protein of unknown function [Hyphomicrobium sp. 1Nfss2.1]